MFLKSVSARPRLYTSILMMFSNLSTKYLSIIISSLQADWQKEVNNAMCSSCLFWCDRQFFRRWQMYKRNPCCTTSDERMGLKHHLLSFAINSSCTIGTIFKKLVSHYIVTVLLIWLSHQLYRSVRFVKSALTLTSVMILRFFYF